MSVIASLEQTFMSAIADLAPRPLTYRAIGRTELTPPITLLAAGKAAAAMCEGALDALGERISGGICVTKDPAKLPRRIEHLVAAHPAPDARSLAAGEQLLRRAEATRAGTILLLVSGGASALACLPAAGVPFADKLAATQALAAAGASIAELNALRKHLSAIKGGRLLTAAGAPVVALCLSDVLGDDPGVIGGGLAAGDTSTFADALRICAGYRVELPATVRQRLECGAGHTAGGPEETPRPEDPRLARHRCEILAGPDDLLARAGVSLRAQGFVIDHQEAHVADAVETLAARLAARAQALAWRTAAGEKRAELAGGEPTIALPPHPGQGGRAQHTAALVAARFADMRWPGDAEIAVLCAGSDGSDGPTDAAGAIVTPASHVAPEAIAGFDSYRALAGSRFAPGPTGTNLGDLYVIACRKALAAPGPAD